MIYDNIYSPDIMIYNNQLTTYEGNPTCFHCIIALHSHYIASYILSFVGCASQLTFFWGAVPGFAIFQRRTPCQLPCRCIF